MSVDKTDDTLKSLYYDPAQPASYSSTIKLHRAALDKGIKITRPKVQAWLEKQETYTLHKPVKRKGLHTSRVYVSEPFAMWQADLVVLPTYFTQYNDGFKYILTVIDGFSKKAWARPLKVKNGYEMCAALTDIVDDAGRPPIKMQTDKGKEFINSRVQQFFKYMKIIHYTTENEETKAQMVELHFLRG